jgi:hypothetical protein
LRNHDFGSDSSWQAMRYALGAEESLNAVYKLMICEAMCSAFRRLSSVSRQASLHDVRG